MSVATNRAQRRHARELGLAAPVDCVMPDAPETAKVEDGQLFTIVGCKRVEGGAWIFNCKPGEETVLRACKRKQAASP